MIPGGQKDLNPACSAAPNHRLRFSAHANPGMVNCEVCGGEAPIGFMIDDGEDTPQTQAELDSECQAIINGTKRPNPWQLYKLIKAVALWQGALHGLTNAQVRSAVAAIYKAL